MKFTVSVDDAAWDAGIDNLLVLMTEAARDATLSGAEEIRDVTKARLTEREHSSLTFSPSAWGEAPAMVDGNLQGSIDAAMVGEDTAWVGPTDLDYARIQELGGEMHGHPVMVYHKMTPHGLRKFTPEFVELLPRPYLQPSTEDVVDSGRLTEIYVEHLTAAIEEATG